MQCPKCQGKLNLDQIAHNRCPNCRVNIYFSPKWRWLRGISCGFLDILLNYRWYPLEGSLGAHVIWIVVVAALFLALLIISVKVFPLEIDLVPEKGPIRLDL